MTTTAGSDVYYDPYDEAIYADPYPAFRRLREEAPLYYNETYDFWALSRFHDVEASFADHATFSSAHGGVLEAIKSGYDPPKGFFIMEDPPMHTAHRGVLSRVFTPRKMNDLEPQVRRYCADLLDPLVGGAGFDVIAELGAKMPMRVIGMLLGIPEQDQEAIRRQGNERLAREPGRPSEYKAGAMSDATFWGDYLDWRADHPADDLMTALLNVEFDGRDGHVTPAQPRGDPRLRQPAVGGRERDDQPAGRLDDEGARRAPRAAAGTGRGSLAVASSDRRGAALRAAVDQRVPLRHRATWSSTARRSRPVVP